MANKVEIKSMWDGDTTMYLVYVNGEHKGSHWEYEDAEQEANKYMEEAPMMDMNDIAKRIIEKLEQYKETDFEYAYDPELVKTEDGVNLMYLDYEHRRESRLGNLLQGAAVFARAIGVSDEDVMDMYNFANELEGENYNEVKQQFLEMLDMR